jgi:hypothetical protein
MNDDRWEQYGAAAGLLFVVLLVVGAFIAGSPPKPDDSAKKIADFFNDHNGALKAGAFLGGLAVPAFLWFLGSVWSRVRRVDEARRLATIAAGGGVAALTLATAGGAVTATTALLIKDLGPSAKLFYVLAGAMTSSSGFGVAAFTAAVGIAAIRNAVFPAWLGYAALVIAIGWLFAGLALVTLSGGIFLLGFIVFLAWLIWILAVSYFLYQPRGAVARP